MKQFCVIFCLISLAACLFDSHHVQLKNSSFRWGYVNSKEFLDIIYNSQGIFGQEAVLAIADMDTIVVLQCLKRGPSDTLTEAQDRLKTAVNFYVLETENYIKDPLQKESSALFGPFDEAEMKAHVHTAYGMEDISFETW